MVVNVIKFNENGHILRWNGNSVEVTDVDYSDSIMNTAFNWLTSNYNMPDGYTEWVNDGSLERDANEIQDINCIDL